jgi:hypothetical protein
MTMERTDLRADFFAAASLDPYLHQVTHHVASAWANGYEQALRDHGLTDGRTHSERHEMALEWLTEMSRKSQAAALVALAELGKLTATEDAS